MSAQSKRLTTMIATLQVHHAARVDLDAELLAEGVQAFVVHAAATALCGPEGTEPQARGKAMLTSLVMGWLAPPR